MMDNEALERKREEAQEVEEGPVEQELERGTVVLTIDPFADEWRVRPVVIITDESYPTYPNEYVGVPLTTRDKDTTIEITDDVKDYVYEDFKKDSSYANPYSPVRIDDWDRTLMKLDDAFVKTITRRVGLSFGK